MARFLSRLGLGICVSIASLATMTGCDSRASRMEELKRAAIRRPKDDDEAPPPKKKPDAKKKDEPKEPKKKDEPKKTKAKDAPKEPKKEGPKVAGAPPKRELPTTSIDQRGWALQNLTTISGALNDYTKEHPTFMKRAIRDNAGVPLLSWRVALLPYLGYHDLYEKFALDEPWDSRTNLPLLQEIPDVYLCPTHADSESRTKTNLLAPVGSTTLFNEDFDSVLIIRVEDGLRNTICLMEVDDELAVPWTKPDDYFDITKLRGLGRKRDDGIFVAFGDGTVRRIPNTVKPADFIALLTMDGGEPVTMAKVSFAVAADPTRATEVDKIDMSSLAMLGGIAGEVKANEEESNDVRDAMNQDEEMVVDERPAPPPEASLAESREMFRELYGPVYKEADTREKKVSLARELFEKSKSMEEDLNGRYVMLQASRVVAMEADEATLASDVIEELTQHYRVDDVPLKSELLVALGKEMDEKSVEMAKEVAEASVLRDDYETASKVLQLAMAALKREKSGSDRRPRGGFGNRDRQKEDEERSDEETELLNLRRRVEAGKSEYRKFRSALVGLDIGSPEANTIAGRYLCFVKEEWEKGLPLLAKCHEPQLREIAAMELVDLPGSEQQLAIGEAWWDYGTDELQAGMRHVVWEHAALWFLAAHNSLPDGLLRVKAEMRINECSKELGSSVVDELRGMFGPRMRERTDRDSTASRRRRRDDDD